MSVRVDLNDILTKYGAAAAGFAPMSVLHFSPNISAQAGPLETAPSISGLICAVFPYFAGLHGGNISLYARGIDYHIVLRKSLEGAAAELKASFPENFFRVFVDVSPFPEVHAAACAGLGAIGANGVLITPDFGSFVFVGTIATDLPLPGGEAPGICHSCGECIRKCPNGAIEKGMCADKCLSEITQKKGALTQEETQLIKQNGMIWGCDICQRVCPMNKNIRETCIPEFRYGLVHSLTSQELKLTNRDFKQQYGNRAFAWRGPSPLRRNAGIIEGCGDGEAL